MSLLQAPLTRASRALGAADPRYDKQLQPGWNKQLCHNRTQSRQRGGEERLRNTLRQLRLALQPHSSHREHPPSLPSQGPSSRQGCPGSCAPAGLPQRPRRLNLRASSALTSPNTKRQPRSSPLPCYASPPAAAAAPKPGGLMGLAAGQRWPGHGPAALSERGLPHGPLGTAGSLPRGQRGPSPGARTPPTPARWDEGQDAPARRRGSSYLLPGFSWSAAGPRGAGGRRAPPCRPRRPRPAGPAGSSAGAAERHTGSATGSPCPPPKEGKALASTWT